MKFNYRILLLVMVIGCTSIYIANNLSFNDNNSIYCGKLRSSVKNEKLLEKWEVKCYLQLYNKQNIPLSLEKKMEDNEDSNAHICCFELQYLGEDVQFLSDIESIELIIDWNRGDEKVYKGKYEINKKTLIDANNQVKYFYLPNIYFSPQYITSLRSEMIIKLKSDDSLRYYGNLKFKKEVFNLF